MATRQLENDFSRKFCHEKTFSWQLDWALVNMVPISMCREANNEVYNMAKDELRRKVLKNMHHLLMFIYFSCISFPSNTFPYIYIYIAYTLVQTNI